MSEILKFIYPEGTRNKPDLGWVWSQCMHMIELKDAICQKWYSGFTDGGVSMFDKQIPRTKAKINEELNAIANLRSSVMSLEKTLADRIESLQAEYDERGRYNREVQNK
tara:strand:+ start:700 stop:1026 length:327 start_codon:yes stop_codon:yes gene_type:complete